MDIKKFLPKAQNDISLAKHTTFKIGGSAKYFLVAKKKKDFIEAVKVANNFKLPFFILAGGSNVLFSDEGFKGLVIKCQMSDVRCQKNEIHAEAGTKLEDLVKVSLKESLTGLEWAAGIPGTVGGAIYGNAQAFGLKMANLVKGVEVLDSKTSKIKTLSQRQCKFSIKNSIFKQNKNLIIISAVLKLKKGNKKEIKRKIKENLNYRRKKHPLGLPSAGSIFVNKEDIKIKNKKLLKEFPELKEFNKKRLIPSAYLIEKCGLKGKKIGQAKISEKHANFIVNLGKARAKDVISLIKLAKKKVKEKFGISLEKEVQIIF